MPRLMLGFEREDEISVPSPAPLPVISSSLDPHTRNVYGSHKAESPPPIFTRISPILVLTLVILALILFCLGALHLFVKYILRSPASAQIHQSTADPDESDPHGGLQRQLQHLFRLHDSGLDQASIDALPLFCYKDVTAGLKGPFDCAVCLCEFCNDDKLRLLPTCGHAFHLYCIDTWLLSNSTCPLCRGTLLTPALSLEPYALFNPDFLGEVASTRAVDAEEGTEDKNLTSKRVFSVRLGRFRSLNCGDREGTSSSSSGSTISNSSLDSRRCYSLGRFQYVEGERDLLVALSPGRGCKLGASGGEDKEKEVKASSAVDREGKKISGRCRGDSFSVSKVWLWSKRSKLNPSSSETHVSLASASSSFTNFWT